MKSVCLSLVVLSRPLTVDGLVLKRDDVYDAGASSETISVSEGGSVTIKKGVKTATYTADDDVVTFKFNKYERLGLAAVETIHYPEFLKACEEKCNLSPTFKVGANPFQGLCAYKEFGGTDDAPETLSDGSIWSPCSCETCTLQEIEKYEISLMKDDVGTVGSTLAAYCSGETDKKACVEELFGGPENKKSFGLLPTDKSAQKTLTQCENGKLELKSNGGVSICVNELKTDTNIENRNKSLQMIFTVLDPDNLSQEIGGVEDANWCSGCLCTDTCGKCSARFVKAYDNLVALFSGMSTFAFLKTTYTELGGCKEPDAGTEAALTAAYKAAAEANMANAWVR